MNIKGICGSVLAVILGIARIVGGIISISSADSTIETFFPIRIGVRIKISSTPQSIHTRA